VTREQVEAVLARFRGDIQQVPPMYSALKRDGRPLYEYARKGIEIERRPREVSIFTLVMLKFDVDRLEIDVDCSKGTYLRSLAEDIGETLGCGAHLTALRRTRIGNLRLDDAVTLEALEALSPEARDSLLRPADTLLEGLPRLDLDEATAARFSHGQSVSGAESRPSARLRVYAEDGRFLGLATASPQGLVAPVRLVAAVIEK
jgi:tRNA pseudouridine55 synthase